MATTDCIRESRYSTEASEYTVEYSQCRALPLHICRRRRTRGVYLHGYSQRFASLLRSRYPDLSRICAGQVVDTFTDVLQKYNATHSCPKSLSDPEFTDFVTLVFEIYPINPSVREFLLRVDDLDHQFDNLLPLPGNCVICFEEMETWRITRTVPCSHTFHRSCLVRWLITNATQVCPLCRCQLVAPEP